MVYMLTHTPSRLLERSLLERQRTCPALLALVSLLLFAGCATDWPPGGLLLSVSASSHLDSPHQGLGPRIPLRASITADVIGGAGGHPTLPVPINGVDTKAGAFAPTIAQPSVTATRQAVLTALEDVSGSLQRTTDVLARLEANPEGLVFQVNGLFASFVEYAIQRRQWVSLTLVSTQRLVQTASEVDDSDMQLALLRLMGPRLEAVMYSAQLLAVWVDFLHLVEVARSQCPSYSIERLFRDTAGIHKKLTPAMTALASLEPEQIEDMVSALPDLMGELNRDLESTREALQLAEKRGDQIVMAKQLMDMVIMGSAMGMTLPFVSPAAPAALGSGLMMGSGGVMTGSRVVVSAEWMEAMRRLVQAGVIAVPVGGAAVQLNASQVLMSQAHDELPKGVREALGEGPEVRGMRQTSRVGAGMAGPPRHHVLPREYRAWFEQRGFTGEMNIDQFCVEMEQASHEAIHGGGNWRLGRTWPGEWNRMIINALYDAETATGRMLTRSEILKIVAHRMRIYNIPMSFIPW